MIWSGCAGQGQPRLLVVEDVHWADPPTLESLATLTQTIAGCPALLVMTSRIEGDPLDHAWRSHTAGSRFDDHRPRSSAPSGGGRPRWGVSRCQPRRRAGAASSGPPAIRCFSSSCCATPRSREAGVPGSVQSLVQARIDQLAAADKQAAAGSVGPRPALRSRRAPPSDRRPVDYDCGDLVRRFLVRPVGDEFLFAHALIRDAVYNSLLRPRRRELHRQAAAWFTGRDPVLRAEHLDRADDPAAPRAYLEAARAQAADYRYERARALIERGLALASESADRFALMCFQGDILHDLGAMAGRPCRLRACPGIELRTMASARRAWLGLAAVKRVTDDLDGAFADLDQAQAAAERCCALEQRAGVHFLRGNLHFPARQYRGVPRRASEEPAARPRDRVARVGGAGARRSGRRRIHARAPDQCLSPFPGLRRPSQSGWSRTHRGCQSADGGDHAVVRARVGRGPGGRPCRGRCGGPRRSPAGRDDRAPRGLLLPPRACRHCRGMVAR